MDIEIPEHVKAWCRRVLRRNGTLGAAAGIYWLSHRIWEYPIGYLFVPDKDVWIAQIFTWIGLIAETIGFAIAFVIAARAGAALLRRLSPDWSGEAARRIDAFLRSRSAPLFFGLISAAAIAIVWGLRATPFIPDEGAYLLQAKLFATGRWTAAPAPLPEFFEQMYVFVSPFTAAKYPPGFSAALVPGVWLGHPVLVPILLVGIAGALIFAIAREIADPSVAAVAWLLWSTDPHAVWTFPPFMSQHLSVALCLASWWALLRYRKTAGSRYLLGLGFFLGAEVITRPFTAFVVAIPIAVVVVRAAARRRDWTALAGAAVIGSLLVAVIPFWSAKTTGDWKTTPLALHVRWYTPYDVPGFGTAIPPPVRVLPPDLARATVILGHDRARHTIGRIPWLIGIRGRTIFGDTFGGWRGWLLPFLLYSLLFIPAEAIFGVVTALLIFLAHLALVHPRTLAVYYVESYPVLYFLAAAGVGMLLGRPKRGEDAVNRPEPSHAPGWIGLVIIAMLVPCALDLRGYRDSQRSFQMARRLLSDKVETISGKAAVFIRYPPTYPAFYSLVVNDPDFATARTWFVHDLGKKNAELAAAAPDRALYRYDMAADRLEKLDRNAVLRASSEERTAPPVSR